MQTVDFSLHAGEHLEQYVNRSIPYADEVNSPPHYNQGGIECIDYIKQVLGEGFPSYCKGNVMKYLHRSDYKGKQLQDLKKAQWYLNAMIKALEDQEE